ncbi:MAG: hypothetical protein JRJ85_14965 [Deltaproteobacteria bacterium]|nr:hypothetical protein [Deltaproteobacteria bacterium]
MKPVKLSLVVICILGLVFGLTPQIFATGGPAPGDECCVVINPGGGALAMKGTMALVYDVGNNHNLDIMLRLERSGEQKFFRINLSGVPLLGLTNEGITCLILNPKETANPAIQTKVTAFVNEILGAFFDGLNATNTRLAITSYSISDCQGVYGCDDGTGTPTYCLIPETDRTSSLGDIVIYAVDSSKANLVNPTCP